MSLPVEPERYELREPPMWRFDLDRREFFSAVGGGLVVLLTLDGQESGGGRRRVGGRAPQEIAAWLHIAEDGAITVYTGKVEIGQNIRTCLAQAISEELHVPVPSIQMVMGDTARTPYDMGTFGSMTTPTMAPQLRRAAAAARTMLIGLAAKQWGTGSEGLRAENGQIVGAGKSIAYGQLTKGQKLLEAVNGATPAPPLGQSVPKVNAREIAAGKHQFPSDIPRPGMLHGCVVRPAGFQAKLVSADTSKAEAMPGVTVVKDRDFLAVAAPTPDAARQAVAAIRANWDVPPQISNRELFEQLKKTADAAEPRVRGSFEEGIKSADKKLSATYTVAYIAHAPLEPRAAVAEWTGNQLTVWTGTQRPFGVRSELAGAFHIPEEQIRVIMPDMGSGYGGKHTGDAALEAARLAKAAGKPVKVVWTREEEFTWAYFRPAGVIEVASGLRADGTIAAWDFHNYNSGASGIQIDYDIPHQRIQFHTSDSPLRQGSYRGLAATANHFAKEVHIDELAHAAGMDPLAFRLKNLKNDRMRAVLEAVKWEPGNKNCGLACGFEKGGYVATKAEIAMENGKPRIVRVVEAFDCGAIVDPDHLRNQIEGAIVMAIGGALFEAIQFEKGRILNARFSKYRVPRFRDVPEIELVLVDRKDLASAGAGETPIVGLAPAVSNAIFRATGVRHRSMPMLV